MNEKTALRTIRERNKRKRLAGWVLLYLFLIAVFILAVLWQARRVNTLSFAPGTLQLTTAKTAYNIDEQISYTLKNGLNHPVTLLNTCPAEPLYVYYWANNTWTRIHDTADAAKCDGQPKQRTILAGDSYTQSFADWPNLFKNPGIYRIVGLATNYTAIPYADFQVLAQPTPTQQTKVIIQKVITPIYITLPGNGGDD